MKRNTILLYNCINKPFMATTADPVNLGLLALSAVLKNSGYRVILIANVDNPGTINKLKIELKKSVLVGVSCMTGDPISNGIKFSKLVKKLAPTMKICWGGYHPTMDYENTVVNSFVDFVVRGQGERAIIELLEALRGKRRLKTIRGLVYERNKKIMVNEIRPNEAIEKFPMYDYQLYARCYKMKRFEEIIYCSSRGCPFECTFCSVSNFYKRAYFIYSNERFFADLKSIVERYNPSSIFFWDDNFFVNQNRVRDFLKEYQKMGYKFRWSAFSRCSVFAVEDKLLMKELVKCNCQRLLFGAESGSPRILKYIKKHIVVRDIINSCKVVTKYGIDPDYTFISGFPGETVADLKMTMGIIATLNRINPRSGVRLFSFTPSPGIPILKDCVGHGFEYPKKLEDWEKYEYHSFLAPWISTKHQELIRELVWITTFVSRQSMPWSGRWWINGLFLLLHYDAKFRLKYNFWDMAWEWKGLYGVYKKHYVDS